MKTKILMHINQNKMEINIKSSMLTNFRLGFLSFIILAFGINLKAQEELSRTYLKLSYTNNMDGTKSLTASLSYKEDKKFVPVQNQSLSFYSGVDLDELIQTVEVNAKGEATVVIPEGHEADTAGLYYYAAKFKGTETLKRASKDISVKDATLELVFNQKSDGKTISVKAFEVDEEGAEVPLNEEVVNISVPTLFGDMLINKAPLEEGMCEIQFPSNLPGDSIGDLQIIAKIKDSEIYGNVVKIEKIPWGKPKLPQHLESTNAKGKLWTHNAPFWMVVTLVILMTGVWSHFGYVIYKIFRIKKIGAEQMK